MNKHIDVFMFDEDIDSIEPFGVNSICFHSTDGDKIHLEVLTLKRGLAIIDAIAKETPGEDNYYGYREKGDR